MTTILLAAPVHVVKQYSMFQWAESLAAIQSASHAEVLCLAVDTSATDGFFEWCENQIPSIMFLHATPGAFATPHQNIAYGMENIRQFFRFIDFEWWLNIECDVIAPSQTANLMVEYAEKLAGEWNLGFADSFDERWFRERIRNAPFNAITHPGKIDWLAAPVPSRHDDGVLHTSFACTLFSRELMQECSFQDAPALASTDGWFLQRVVKPKNKFNVIDLPPGLVTVQHLRNPDPVANERWLE